MQHNLLHLLCETSLTLFAFTSLSLSVSLNISKRNLQPSFLATHDTYSFCQRPKTVSSRQINSDVAKAEIRLGFRERQQGKSRRVGRTSGKASRRSLAGTVSQYIVQMGHRKRSVLERKTEDGKRKRERERDGEKMRQSWTIVDLYAVKTRYFCREW